MSKSFFCRIALMTMPLLFNSARSQNDHFAYAVTAVNKGGSEWIALRKLDTRTGEFSNILLNVRDKDRDLFDFASFKEYANKNVTNTSNGTLASFSPQPALSSSVAAIAYDRKTNRLYYAPMSIDQLRYVDLTTMEVVAFSDQFFSKAGKYDFKTAGPINRMVIAPDDFGYTITNDGNHLIRFSTNGAPVLTDLGELQDDPLNKDMSIRNNPCANSGGDLVADDAGSLFLVTGSNRVFKVDIATRKTSYLATISALPAKFTTSGVAVSEDGKMLISSSLYADGYFTVDPENWNATPSSGLHEAFGSADLANSNVLHSKTAANSNLFITKAPDKLSQFRVFPNPVMDDEVSIQFNGLKPGNYTIQLASVLGNTVLKQKATVIGNTQTELVHIPGSTAQGFYYVSILDENNKVVGTQKLVVERW
jgi:hypothetical protein